jgi:hypothetical protein
MFRKSVKALSRDSDYVIESFKHWQRAVNSIYASIISRE